MPIFFDDEYERSERKSAVFMERALMVFWGAVIITLGIVCYKSCSTKLQFDSEKQINQVPNEELKKAIDCLKVQSQMKRKLYAFNDKKR